MHCRSPGIDSVVSDNDNNHQATDTPDMVKKVYL